MRTRILISMISLLLCGGLPVVAQQNNSGDETIVVKKKDLPENLVKDLEAKSQLDSMQKKIESYGKWVGIGKEIGTAVDSSLSAITNQADHFSQTGVGKLTVALVVWKVLGSEAIHLVSGVVELIIFLPLWIWSYRKFCFPHRILSKKSDGIFGAKEWTVAEPVGDEEWRIAHWVAGGVLMLVILITIFTF